jgi:hypothetical protein
MWIDPITLVPARGNSRPPASVSDSERLAGWDEGLLNGENISLSHASGFGERSEKAWIRHKEVVKINRHGNS